MYNSINHSQTPTGEVIRNNKHSKPETNSLQQAIIVSLNLNTQNILKQLLNCINNSLILGTAVSIKADRNSPVKL